MWKKGMKDELVFKPKTREAKVCLMLAFVRWKLLSLGHSFPIILFL
jgi:hypothetical protein